MGTSSNFGNMFSMAGASLFFPSSPCCRCRSCSTTSSMTSPTSISLDRVDDDYLNHPRHWDMNFIRNFMLIIGPVSSVFIPHLLHHACGLPRWRDTLPYRLVH